MLWPQIFTCAREWPSLVSACSTVDGGLSCIFSKGVLNWRKNWRICSCNFWGRRRESTKLCHMMCHKVGVITYVKNFVGPQPQKFGRAKTSNLERFRTTFNFDRKYLKNWSRYPKLETNFIDSDHCGVWQEIGELWSTNKKVTGVDVDLLKFRIWHDFKQILTTNVSGAYRRTENR